MHNICLPFDPSTLGVHVTEKAKRAGIGLPRRAKEGDSGYDLKVIEPVIMPPQTMRKFPTGLGFNFPGHNNEPFPWHAAMMIEPRTGLGIKGNIPGARVVDAGYRPFNDDGTVNEDGLVLALWNIAPADPSDPEKNVLRFKVGDSVAQGKIIICWTPELFEIEASDLDITDRAGGRFGSTGR